ncbi:MAG: ATP-dependent zinc metalloprotease FtsH [Myxococcota bacterium]|nr:ATP-dependent zinc metalloprotease FtsH [Myxococcota bacterium]
MKPNNRGILFALLLAVVMIFAFMMVGDRLSAQKEYDYSKVTEQIRAGEVKELSIRGQDISGVLHGGQRFTSTGPHENADSLIRLLDESNTAYKFEPVSEGGVFGTLLPVISIGIALLLVFMVFRQIQGASGRAMSFGKSRARMLEEDDSPVTFADVAGVEEAKEELQEVVEFLKDPRKFTRLGARIPKGVLMVGPPGTGKTLLARAVAGEAGVPFFTISGSDFVEMFVGVGASRVRDLFEQGKKNAPCIIFIDEIDAVGRQRGAGFGGGHDEREQTLNQLLVEMDGFESSEGVILVAATNRVDVLDPALLRPGRFDRRVVVGNPDVKGRKGILEVHSRRIIVDEEVDLDAIAKGTPGFSGADLESLVNEAALLAARKDKDQVEMEDFENAKDKVTMGAERRSMVIPEKERRRTAYHEAGHAIVARALPEADKVHKVTIIPRGQALGVTQMFPDEDRLGSTQEQLKTRLAVYMGGRAAEEIIFEEITTGAHNDIQQATRIARAMITEFGMSDSLGPVNLGGQGEVFLGRDYSQTKGHSEHTAQLIDSEVRSFLDRAYTKAKSILQLNLPILHRIANRLLELETLDNDEFERLIAGLNTNDIAFAKP